MPPALRVPPGEQIGVIRLVWALNGVPAAVSATDLAQAARGTRMPWRNGSGPRSCPASCRWPCPAGTAAASAAEQRSDMFRITVETPPRTGAAPVGGSLPAAWPLTAGDGGSRGQ